MHFTQMAIYYIYKSHHIRARPIHGWQGGKMGLATSRGCWLPSVGDINLHDARPWIEWTHACLKLQGSTYFPFPLACSAAPF
jgi:hypothetical protein